jgi:GNAT superfamily N-acetyltransferase
MPTPSELRLREATADDVHLILSFVRKKATFDQVSHLVEATEETLRNQLFVERPSAFVVIAELDGRAVGFALYFLSFSSFLACPGIWLDDLFVDEDARGNGVGSALLTYLSKIARERGYGRVEWVTADTNHSGLEFYRRNGALVQDTVRVLRLDRSAIARLAEKGTQNGREVELDGS